MSAPTARDLRLLLESLGGEVVRKRDNRTTYRVPIGKGDVEVQVLAKDAQEMPMGMLKGAATRLQLSLRELLELLGVDNHRRGKPKGSQRSASGPTKADVVRAVDELRTAVSELDSAVRNGQRDPQWLRHVLICATAARSELNRPLLPGQPKRSDVEPLPDSPDDSKYRPSKPPNILTGPARATGVTAKAVRRQTALTKWEHAEMEAKS